MSEIDDEELVTAYLDGVAELTPDERARAEAILEVADAEATSSLLAELRALPPPADPDYRQLEAAIAKAVPENTAKGFHWGAISGVLAAAATIALFVAVRHDDGHTPTIAPVAPIATAVHVDDDPAGAIFFNGDEVDSVDLDALPDDALDAALTEDDDLGDVDDFISLESPSGGSGTFDSAIGAQIDQLDDAALDRLDQWLATKQGG